MEPSTEQTSLLSPARGKPNHGKIPMLVTKLLMWLLIWIIWYLGAPLFVLLSWSTNYTPGIIYGLVWGVAYLGLYMIFGLCVPGWSFASPILDDLADAYWGADLSTSEARVNACYKAVLSFEPKPVALNDEEQKELEQKMEEFTKDFRQKQAKG
mmetsp:Transcript_156269/g.276171  ORF Transcript_156269/g.276171 Transcript_156269/m.276171 type:complete len:154 (-) Transcript_156269:153-614(-)